MVGLQVPKPASVAGLAQQAHQLAAAGQIDVGGIEAHRRRNADHLVTQSHAAVVNQPVFKTETSPVAFELPRDIAAHECAARHGKLVALKLLEVPFLRLVLGANSNHFSVLGVVALNGALDSAVDIVRLLKKLIECPLRH